MPMMPCGTQQPNQGINRSSFPNWTAWVRRRAPSLSNTRLECVLTVFSLTYTRAAISLLLTLRRSAPEFPIRGA